MEMNSSVTDWITQLRNGHNSACDKLWPFYLQRLTAIISQKLEYSHTEVSDEEDVLIDTCEVCFRKIKEGVYPNVSSRHDLWRLLTKIATRKSIDQIRRSRKGVDRLRTDAMQTIHSNSNSYEINHIDSFPGAEPTPEFAVVKLRMQGFTLKEIADKTGKSLPTVQRYLSFVREAWSQND